MKRITPLLLVLAGWFIAQIAGTPQQVYAQARTSLASLQTAIDNIINGNTVVGSAWLAEEANAVPAVNSGGGVAINPGSLQYALDTAELQVSDGERWQSVPIQGGPIRIGDAPSDANFDNAGMVRFHQGALEVSDGISWRPLAFAD